ncbi:MAG: TetR/AcrR family transcriptional regulator [Omnitrophica WOR_2 bacterium]
MQQRSEETRTHILEAALQLFSQHGYDATGIAEVCQAAGVSKGAFYHHFPSKLALFLQLLQNWLIEINRQLAVVQDGAQDIPQTLFQMAGKMQWVFQEAQGKLPLFLEFWLQASRDPQIRAAVNKPYRQYHEYFAGLIQQGIDEGSLKPVDPQAAARILVALATGLLLQGLLDPDGADWGAVTQESIQLFIAGMQRRPS